MSKKNRSKILSKLAKELSSEKKFPDLTVEAGETRTLSYRSRELKSVYSLITPNSVDEIKDIMGVSDEVTKNARPDADLRLAPHRVPGLFSRMHRPDRSAELRAKMISPEILTDEKAKESERLEAFAMARKAVENYVYGFSAHVVHMKPLIEAYLKIKGPIIFIPFLQNITVHNDATLNIAADTPTVWANKVELYGTGKIDCQGPTTFNVVSMAGNL